MSFGSGAGWRDVYLAAGARGLSVTGDFLAATALALAFQSAGRGGVAVSGLLLASVVPLVLLAPVTGRIVDRVDSRRLLVGVGLAQAVICVVLAWTETPMLVIALVALLACGLAVTQPTLAALLPAMVSRADLPRAAALNQTMTSIGGLAAPALAGLLVGEFGVRVPLLLDAGTYLALAVAGLLIRTRRGARRVTTAERPADPAFHYWRDPLLAATTIAIAGVVLGVGAINVVIIFFLRETLAASTTAYGLIEALWGVGLLGGSWVLARLVRRMRDDGALVQGTLITLAGTCLAILAMAFAPGVAWVVPLYLIGGFFNGGENVLHNVLVARRVPDEAHGRAFAILVGWAQGAGMAGYAMAGLLLELFTPRTLVFGAGAAGFAVCALLVIPILRTVRRERAAAPDAGELVAPAPSAA